MEVKQVYSLVNDATKEILGDSVILAEDLTNVVDVGTALFRPSSVDRYVKSLVDHIGKVIFVNRPYSGGAPSVMMDGWEYGAVLQKISTTLPEASENETWELEDGASYDQNIFYKPNVQNKFYNKYTTFEIARSITEKQVKGSFSSAEQLNGFVSMLYTAVENALTVKTDALIMRTINSMIGDTIYADYAGSAMSGATSGVKAINLLYLYNTRYNLSLTAANAISDPAFIRFASYVIGLTADRMTKMSKLYNVGGAERFTPADRRHIVLLSDFASAAGAFLESDTYHNEFVKWPNAETVPYWQGSGTDYGFSSVSAVKITTGSGNSIDATGILGVIFDRDALGVCKLDQRVTTHYNAKAEFFNNYYKFDAGYFNDLNENFVVFGVQDNVI